MAVYDSERRKIKLGHQIGRGGESAVYRVEGRPSRLVKVYTTPHIAVYQRKLTWMLAHPPDDPTAHLKHTSLAWPLDVLYVEHGSFVGYLMPYVQNAVTALKVFNPRLRAKTLPGFDRRYLHRTAQNLAAAVEALHARDYVIGDLHESNIMVTTSALVTLIDTDSFQVEAEGQIYPCIVGKPEYTPPELQGKSFREVRRAPEHDCFGLGVLIFQLLMGGNHPFRGRWLGSSDPPSLEEKIGWGLFPYVPDSAGLVAPPPTGLGLDTLHPDVAGLMRRCFVDGHRKPDSRPTPVEWKQALATAERNLVACSQGHYYANYLDSCPKCRTKAAPRQRPRPVAPRPVPRPPARPRQPAPTATGLSDVLQILFGFLFKRPVTGSQLVVWGILIAIIWPCVGPCLVGAFGTMFSGLASVPVHPTDTLPPQVMPRPTDLPPIQHITDARGVPMVFVPAGPFEMGGTWSYAKPIHTVTLDAFYIDQYEVTNARFAAFLNEQNYDSEISAALLKIRHRDFHLYYDNGMWYAEENYADHPVVSVNWFEAQGYCEWRGGRLPTEAEWEKAARGTDKRRYPWGSEFSQDLCNTAESNIGRTTPVGKYSPLGDSPYGCVDMAGNVKEWVHDWYLQDYYSVSPSSNPPGPGSGSHKILRGGNWSNEQASARTAARGNRAIPTYRNVDGGFRCMVPDPASARLPTYPPATSIPPPPSVSTILIPAGAFRMGDEYNSIGQPIHAIILDEYYIDKYEVTNAQYAACVQAGVCRLPGDCSYWSELTYYDADKTDHPVACVDWNDAQTYCEWQGGRLPTEAEWEKAARGTDGRSHPWGEAPPDCDKAQYDECGDGTVPVGSKPAGVSPYGVHNMAGNVGEWVADWYDPDYYAQSPVTNPQGPDSGASKVRRGGDWFISAGFLRAGTRFIEGHPGKRSNRVGFRCVVD